MIYHMASDELLPGITVRAATPADATACVAIHEDAARWLWERGIRQWRPGVFQIAWLDEPISRRWLFVAERAGEPIGMVVIEPEDEQVWPAEPENAGYVHGLRVVRGAAGQGVGAALLKWAEGHIASLGKPFARLDCIAGNLDLRAYYVRAGYANAGIVMGGTSELARFEKRVIPLSQVDHVEAGGYAYYMRRATPEDADALLALFREAAEWLLARGIDQWRPEQFEREALLRHIAPGEIYVAERDGEVAGTLALTWTDPRIWGEQLPDAGYVHWLAIRRSDAGRGLGRALLDWAAGQVARTGRTLLRLDCMRDNPRLRAHYERAGFAHVRDRMFGAFDASLYEKRVDGMATSEIIPTPHGRLTIRPAVPEDLDALEAIDESTGAWLQSRGIDAGRPPKPLREILADRVSSGTMLLALLDGQPAGMMTLLWEPEGLWADLPGDAVYVHGLMVHRDFAGKEIGRRLLEWAERRAYAGGKPLVRLDCMAENPELRAYYERAGYAHRGDVALPHRTAARYEKRVQPPAPAPHSPSPRRERGSGGEDTQ